MDHQQQKAEHKRNDREERHRHERATEASREHATATGTRIIHPTWLAAVGLALATVALLRWMAIF